MPDKKGRGAGHTASEGEGHAVPSRLPSSGRTRRIGRRACYLAAWLAAAWTPACGDGSSPSTGTLNGAGGTGGSGAQGGQAGASSGKCVPSCRAGYTCLAGTCVSECNPECPEGKNCVAGECVSPSKTFLYDYADEQGGSNFVLHGSKWDHIDFSVSWENFTKDLSAAQQTKALQVAFDAWRAACPTMSFLLASDSTKADFKLRFATGEHGDTSPFDGSGGPAGNVLAHAYFPGTLYQGALHFDDAETWSTDGSGDSINLSAVAIHEIGHLLGLDHSDDKTAIMYPYYQPDVFALGEDDIQAIRELYGCEQMSSCGSTCAGAGKSCGSYQGCNCGSCGADQKCDGGECVGKTCPEKCAEAGFACGSDQGCNCGSCGANEACANGSCVAKPCSSVCAGAGKSCGNYQGCDCGSCGANETCQNGSCQQKGCTEICQGASVSCGNYQGCNCGTCSPAQKCSGGSCMAKTCSELCGDAGLSCGSYQGCDCGSCGAGQKCDGGACVTKTCPEKCAEAGFACGTSQGCNCGTCGANEACANGVCTPKGCTQICQEGGAQCGTYQGCNCGTCGSTQKCSGGSCVAKSCPELCGDAGFSCGSYQGCDCGSCGSAETCNSGSCQQKPCWQLCSEGGKSCGSYQGCDCGSCGGNQSCSNGTCITNCSYQASPGYPSFTSAAPYTCPGGIVMSISGQLDASGNLTVYAKKTDGSTFGSGTYSVRVFDPNAAPDQQCKGFNTQKTSSPNGIGGSQLTFPSFPSQLTCGGADKAYCIVKDGGGNPAHFCSGRLVVSYD